MKIYLASGNAHKAAELRTLAAASGSAVSIHSAREVGGMPAVNEDTGTFVGNARKKAAALLPLLPPGAWALADDSGVCVDALDGATALGAEANRARQFTDLSAFALRCLVCGRGLTGAADAQAHAAATGHTNFAEK